MNERRPQIKYDYFIKILRSVSHLLKNKRSGDLAFFLKDRIAPETLVIRILLLLK